MAFRIVLFFVAIATSVFVASCSKSPTSKSPDADLAKWSVRAEVLMVAVPEDLFLELYPMLCSPSNIDAACDKLLEAVKSGKGLLTGRPVLWPNDKTRGIVESIVEFRYPVEYEPPKIHRRSAIVDPREARPQ